MRKSFKFVVVMVATLGLAGAAQGMALTSARISIPLGTALIPPPITVTGVAGWALGAGQTATIRSNDVTGTAAAGAIFEQVWGTGWTTGRQTLVVPATTISGGSQTPRTVTAWGSDLRDAGGAGTLVLISPLFIRTNLVRDIPTFAILTLNYPVPEPASLLLVGLGIAGLALRGRPRA